MLAYSRGVEMLGILHNSFTITWEFGGHILVMLPFYQLIESIP